jgi:hypothetical protein
MADDFGLDFSELTKLAADLGTVSGKAGPKLRSAIEYTSVAVKKGAQQKVGKRRHWRQAAAAIDYEVKASASVGGSSITSEIGYDKDKPAGKLGNLVEFGAPGSPNALTPGNELQTALHEQEADFERGLSIAIQQAEREAGL